MGEPVHISAFDLQVRYQIYHFFAEECRPPSAQEIAGLLHASGAAVVDSFHKLHARHMLFLEPGAGAIRMAHPFSAVPTRFKWKGGRKKPLDPFSFSVPPMV